MTLNFLMATIAAAGAVQLRYTDYLAHIHTHAAGSADAAVQGYAMNNCRTQGGVHFNKLVRNLLFMIPLQEPRFNQVQDRRRVIGCQCLGPSALQLRLAPVCYSDSVSTSDLPSTSNRYTGSDK